MFTTGFNILPTIQTENSHSHVAGKNVQASARKPFLDRGVNGMTPTFKKLTEKDLPPIKTCENPPVLEKTERLVEKDLLIDDYFYNSEIDYDCHDFVDKSMVLNTNEMNKILRNVFNIRDCPTPPPEIDDVFIFEELKVNLPDMSFNPVELEEIDDMPPPIDYDLDDLNNSY